MTGIVHFSGIELANPSLASLIDASLNVAQSLQDRTGGGGAVVLQSGVSRLALIAAMGASSSLLALAGAICNLGSQPADIGVAVDNDGNLVLRCGHSPPHEWAFESGQKI